MRVKTNLDPYFDKMKLEDMNLLWSVMVDMKHYVRSMQHIIEKGVTDRPADEAEKITDFAKHNLEFYAKNVDEFMLAYGMESLFGTDKKEKLADEDYKYIIARYYYLMSEPE